MQNFQVGNAILQWKRLLLFECEGVLKLKKVQNNRRLVQRYQSPWKIHSCSRLLWNTTVTTKQNRENYSLNNNYALLQGFLGGIPFYNTGEVSFKLPLDVCELQKSKNKEWMIKLLWAVMSTKTSIHGFFMFFVSVSKLCFGCWASKIRQTKEKAKKSESVPWKYEMHEQMVRAELSTSG